MTKVEAIVIRERVEIVIDAVVRAIAAAASSGNESGDGLVWSTQVDNVTHNRTGLSLGEVEVG